MKLIDSYIIRQYLQTFLFLLAMIISIAVMVDFVEKIDSFLEHKPPLSEIVFDYYLNFIPFWGNMFSPVIGFLAVIFFTSRMASRTEIIPLFGAGVSFYRLFLPYLATSILLASASFYLKAFSIPNATEARIEFEYKYFKKRKISRKRDIHKKVAKDTYVYIGYYNEKKQEGHTFGLERTKDGDIIAKIEAKRIKWVDSTQIWQLFNVVTRYLDGHKEEIDYHARVDTTFLLAPDDIYIKEEAARSKTLPELLEYIELEEMRGSDILKELYIERHRRYSDPAALIILTMIGFAMSSRKSRGGTALQIILGILLCFFYLILLFLGQALVGEKGPIWLGVWGANFIFLPIAILLLRFAPK